MSIDRRMDGEDVVHVCGGILLSHEKGQNDAICSSVVGPRDCHAVWSGSGREGHISYDVTYMWNLKTGYK